MTGALWTVAGLIFTFAGITCGSLAYVQTLHEHDSRPVWPWAVRKWHRTVELAKRVRRRLFRRPVSMARVAADTAFATDSASAVTALATGPDVPSYLAVEDQVRLLATRLENAERQAAIDRRRLDECVASLRSEISDQGQRLDEADRRLDLQTKSIAVSTARLQIVGLVLVGLGTVLMAIPAFAPATPPTPVNVGTATGSTPAMNGPPAPCSR